MRARTVAMALLTLAATAGAAATGRLAGTVSPPGRALKVGVVERIPATIKALRDKRRWGRLDQATGKYVVDNLAPGKYDLVVETPRGRIEGVELSVRGEAREPTYDLNVGTGQLSVQRFDISEYIEEGQLLTDTERDALIRRKLRIDKLLERVEKTLKVARFMDANRPLYVHGTRRRAVVLMELARKDRFYAEKGDQVIWRVESWPFLWRYDVWHKPNKGLTVWQRMRVPASEFARMGYVFDPALGGIEVKAGETTTFDLTLPEELPSSLGKVPQ